jgi:predicted RNA-binding Zn-ribbon protein involved in translation (DUF1610 family)
VERGLKYGREGEKVVSEIKTLFRHCPACGRRFEIRVVSKKPLENKQETYVEKHAYPVSPIARGGMMYGGIPLAVEEDYPVTIDITEFSYTYRCKHCGHQWAEMHTEERKE